MMITVFTPEKTKWLTKLQGISILSRYAFDNVDRKAVEGSREALKCLANAFLLNEDCRQTFVDLGFAPPAAERLKVDDRHDEFLASRILFLLTYNTRVDFEELIQQNGLANSINHQISRHAKTFSKKSGRRKSDANPIQDMALNETLKLMFNITYYYPDQTSQFTPAIEPLISLVLNHPLSSPPLEPPINYLLNALLNLDLASADKKTPMGPQPRTNPLFPYSAPESVADRFCSIFYKAVTQMPERQLDQAAAPLCTLLRRQYELASPQMGEWMRCILLPRARDREKVLGIGETMAARLLRLSCAPGLPTLRENISSLLFELSDKDAKKFVKNIGYGFAAGFLLNNNIEIPSSATEAGCAMSDDSNQRPVEINPITGQRLAAEQRDAKDKPQMTPDEKEREAERLFVLFERLKATGVVDVKNPVEQALHEGRFEELPD